MRGAVALLLFAVTGCVLGQCITGRAWGHEPGTEWMMDGSYRNQNGEHCCSPGRDCQPIPADAVERTAAGWRYKPTGEIVPDANVHRSRDPQDRYWRCEGTRHWSLGGQAPSVTTRCLFIGGVS